MNNWNVKKNEMPLFDGEYLCWINEPQECGAIHEYYKVVTCQNNIWLVGVLQFVKAWKELPKTPFDEKSENEFAVEFAKWNENYPAHLKYDEKGKYLGLENLVILFKSKFYGKKISTPNLERSKEK